MQRLIATVIGILAPAAGAQSLVAVAGATGEEPATGPPVAPATW